MEDSRQMPRMEMGRALRLRRKELGLSLLQVAEGAGLSVGFISQLERGLTAPSLSSLTAIARVLDAPVGAFLDQPERPEGLSRPANRLASNDGGTLHERLTTNFPGSELHAMVVHYPAGMAGVTARHDGEELIVMLHGTLSLALDDHEELLAEGDSVHYSARRLHRIWNGGTQTATFLWCSTMDVFGDTPLDPGNRRNAVGTP